MTTPTLPAWPDRDKYVMPTPYGEGMTMAQIADYERDRAEAAMARLKLLEQHAREVLQWRRAFFDWTQNDPECFCSSEVLCDFDNLEYALRSIGELPEG